jgi:transcriptional regulator with XRE-family HTH domain
MTEDSLLALAAARRYGKNGNGRAIRKRARLSQREVGIAVGVSHASISNWESGAAAPHGEPGERWARLLDSLLAQEIAAEAGRPQTV